MGSIGVAEGLSKKEKGLMGMDNSVVTAGLGEIRGLNGNGTKYNKKMLYLIELKKKLQKKFGVPPWLLWLSGLNASLRSIGSLVQFPISECAWVADQVPSGGEHKGKPHSDASLPLFLHPFSSL